MSLTRIFFKLKQCNSPRTIHFATALHNYTGFNEFYKKKHFTALSEEEDEEEKTKKKENDAEKDEEEEEEEDEKEQT